MPSVKTLRPYVWMNLFLVFGITSRVQAANTNEYFDTSSGVAGSGVADAGSYTWENNWTTDATGATATTDWPSDDATVAYFPRFVAGNDVGGATGASYTVTINSNHTIAGMALQEGGSSTNTAAGKGLTIAASGTAKLILFSGQGAQGFFSGANAASPNLNITAPIDGDAITPLQWNGFLSGAGTQSGSLFLYGNNTYTGGTILNSSAGLNFNSATSFGTGPITYSSTNTFGVLANPTGSAPNLTINNPLTMRDSLAASITMLYTGLNATFTDWTLGKSGGAFTNIITVGNSSYTTAKLTIGNGTTGIKGDASSAVTVTSGNLVNGTLVVNGTSTYGGTTQIGANTASTGQPTLQADDGTGLPTNSFLILNGGVLQTSGTFSRTVDINGNSPAMEWNTNGGGFSAIGNQLTVNLASVTSPGGAPTAGGELVWGTTAGIQIVGPLKFGSITANALTVFQNPIDMDNSGSAATRTITVTGGAGGDSAEMHGILRNSSGAASLTKNGTGTLALTGANTYTGKTTIATGTLVASSLNKVSGGSASSSLGAPTTVANGTIGLGATTTAGTLSYNGAGEATDRVIDLAGTTGGGVIDQSGTGLLKFTSNFTATGAGAKTLTLQGSTAGTGEISGKIVNSSSATAVMKAGSGTWTLSGANTYTGTTTVSGGTLAIGNDNALGTTTFGQLTLTGGAIAASGGPRTIANNTIISTNNGTISGSNDITFGGSFTNSTGSRTLTVSNSGLTTFGTVNLSEAAATGRTLTITGAGNTTFGGVIQNAAAVGAGNGSLTFNSSYTGTATINGTNSYTGTTTLSKGTFVLGNKAAFGTSTVLINGVNISASADLSGGNAIANATVTLGGADTFQGSNNIEFTGTVTETAGRTITNNISGASLKWSGPVNLSSNGNNNTMTITGSGNTTIGGAIGNGINGSTASGLTMAGTGTSTLILGGMNTYTGPTLVSGGTLLVNGSITSATTVSSGAFLGGTGGMITGTLTNNGTVAPGASIGQLNVTGTTIMGSGSTLAIELGTGTSSDRLAITGDLDLTAANDTLSLSGVTSGGPWTIATYSSLVSGAHFDNIVGMPMNYTIDYGTGSNSQIQIVPSATPGDFNGDGKVDAADYVSLRKQYSDITTGPGLTAYNTWHTNFGTGTGGSGGSSEATTAVPEPASVVLVMLGFAALAIQRRFRFVA